MVIMESEMIGARKGNRIQPKAPFLTQLRQSLTGERRSNRYRHVELDRIQGNGVRHVLSVNQGRNQRLVRGPAESLGQSGDERKTENMPYVDNSGRHQDREQRRAPHLHVLRDEQNLPALDAVGHHAPDQREQEDGNAAEKLIQSEQER